jgi:exodeoxyribonuclease-3
MQLATFDVNGIGSRLDNLLEWLARESPDVVCLQELKAPDTAFPAKALMGAGYEALWHGQRGCPDSSFRLAGARPKHLILARYLASLARIAELTAVIGHRGQLLRPPSLKQHGQVRNLL